jgi:hypothetical protein
VRATRPSPEPALTLAGRGSKDRLAEGAPRHLGGQPAGEVLLVEDGVHLRLDETPVIKEDDVGKGKRVGLIVFGILVGLYALRLVTGSAGRATPSGFLNVCAYSSYDTKSNRCLQDDPSANSLTTDVFGWGNSNPILIAVQERDGTGRWVTQGPGRVEVDPGGTRVEDFLSRQGVNWSTHNIQIRFVAYDLFGDQEGAYILDL